MIPVAAPSSVAELLLRAEQLAGCTLAEIAHLSNQPLPQKILHAKGWIGKTLEILLGADAGVLSQPDFRALGIELKTIPINRHFMPKESTYVCHINLKTIQQETWQHSTLFNKLKCVLWIPIETERDLLFADRRVGTPHLWQPTDAQVLCLQRDWQEFVELICEGRIESITARQGSVLQIRPKAANSRALCAAINDHGEYITTLPRGFYLRSVFTKEIFESQ